MEVTGRLANGAEITIRFADGDHHGELTVDAHATAWVLSAP
jgi:hypothetical protein